jgi:hypothetical protein
VLQFSSLCDGYQKTADNTYTLPQTAELIALFQSDPKMPQGRWRRLLLLKDVAQITTTPGSFHWAAGMLTVHPYDNADPALTIEIPDVRMGILAAYGHVIASNLHIRGTRNTGTYGFSGILQLTDCLLSENGWNGVDTSRQSSVLYKRIASVNNGNDGYGVHRLGVGTFTQCYAAHNGDDGFSPHEEGIMRLTDCVSEHNADRGTVAVQGSMMTLKRCQLYHNGGQNLSLEAGAEGVMQQVIADTSGTPDNPTFACSMIVHCSCIRSLTAAVNPSSLRCMAMRPHHRLIQTQRHLMYSCCLIKSFYPSGFLPRKFWISNHESDVPFEMSVCVLPLFYRCFTFAC